jgi:glucose/arabinose dehydrogenase
MNMGKMYPTTDRAQLNSLAGTFRALIALVAGASFLAACGEPATDGVEPSNERVRVNGFTLPQGFTATLFAEGFDIPRHIAVNDNGDVYVALRSGQARFAQTDEPGGIAALRDSDGDGIADIVRSFGPTDVDTGLAIYEGHLYVASMTTIYAYRLAGELVPSGDPEVVVAGLPLSGSGHRTKPITFDTDGNLYTQVGSPSNSCQIEPGTPGSPGMQPCTLLEEHGGVFRFDADARNQVHAENHVRYSTGQRNVVALEWNDAAGALYLLMHDRDSLNQLWPEHFTLEDDIELPAEEFHRLERNDDLGWPYTYYDQIRGERMVSPEYGGDGQTVAEGGRYKEPLIGFPGHWAPDDLVFYEADQFPERYRHGAFIAFHGQVSPRRPDRGGYNVVFVPMNADGDVTGEWEIFADDFEIPESGSDVIGRPNGLAIDSRGSLYIVDDAGGRIWKVSYTG